MHDNFWEKHWNMYNWYIYNILIKMYVYCTLNNWYAYQVSDNAHFWSNIFLNLIWILRLSV